MKDFVYLKNVVTLALDKNKCTGCAMCTDVCPHQVFWMDGKRATIQRRDACMECGACRQNCPAVAIYVESGVGCAAAVINSLLGKTDAACCCGPQANTPAKSGDGCCC